MEKISPQDLNEISDATVMDVRLSDDYEAAHVPGATSNCVFEVAFLDRLAEQVPEKSSPCAVYGADSDCLEAETAAAKMERAGYTDVRVLAGGIVGWKDAGLPVDGSGTEPSSPSPRDGIYSIDLDQSRIEWTGRNLLNKHYGTIGIQSGELEVSEGRLTGGQFVIDMNSMRCHDLDGELHDVLIAHLKSDDFFDTEIHPTAEVKILESERVETAQPGGQNLTIRGELTLKGKTAPIELAASAGITPEGKLAAQSTFLVDRTVWNVLYGSGKFFSRLGQHLVNDLIDLEVVVATN